MPLAGRAVSRLGRALFSSCALRASACFVRGACNPNDLSDGHSAPDDMPAERSHSNGSPAERSHSNGHNPRAATALAGSSPRVSAPHAMGASSLGLQSQRLVRRAFCPRRHACGAVALQRLTCGALALQRSQPSRGDCTRGLKPARVDAARSDTTPRVRAHSRDVTARVPLSLRNARHHTGAARWGSSRLRPSSSVCSGEHRFAHGPHPGLRSFGVQARAKLAIPSISRGRGLACVAPQCRRG